MDEGKMKGRQKYKESRVVTCIMKNALSFHRVILVFVKKV